MRSIWLNLFNVFFNPCRNSSIGSFASILAYFHPFTFSSIAYFNAHISFSLILCIPCVRTVWPFYSVFTHFCLSSVYFSGWKVRNIMAGLRILAVHRLSNHLNYALMLLYFPNPQWVLYLQLHLVFQTLPHAHLRSSFPSFKVVIR